MGALLYKASAEFVRYSLPEEAMEVATIVEDLDVSGSSLYGGKEEEGRVLKLGAEGFSLRGKILKSGQYHWWCIWECQVGSP